MYIISYSDPLNSQQLCLIRSRLVACDPPTYDWESLQNDMIWAFVLGKSKINHEGFRKEFKFYKKKSSITLDLSVLDLSGVHIKEEDSVFKVTTL